MTALAGFRHLAGYLGPRQQRALLADLRAVIEAAPLFVPRMPRVRPALLGAHEQLRDARVGVRPGWWLSIPGLTHPATGLPWPAMPRPLLDLWEEVADFPHGPEACLINYYSFGARMGSHRDADEQDFAAPVLSVSLGDDAVFHVGGTRRTDPKQRVVLKSGDVIVLGGKARLAYHGIDRILPGSSPLLAEGGRLNLTLRRVARA